MVDYMNKPYEVFYVPERQNKFVRLYNKDTMILYKLRGYQNIKDSIILFSEWFFGNHIATDENIENYFLMNATPFFLRKYIRTHVHNRSKNIEKFIIDNFFNEDTHLILTEYCKFPKMMIVERDIKDIKKSKIVKFEYDHTQIFNHNIVIELLEYFHREIKQKYKKHCVFIINNHKSLNFYGITVKIKK
jgi:hypothetical protein